MKKALVLNCLLALLGAAQEEPTRRQSQKEGYRPADVKVLGDLNYGQSSGEVLCSVSPPYNAFVFNGNGGDKIEVTVKRSDGTAFVVIADSGLVPIAEGSNALALSLPNRGPDVDAFYIVFRAPESKPARFTVQLKKLE